MNLNRLHSRRGYTLIELMIVVAIISIIVSIVAPRLNIFMSHAYQAKTRSGLGSIRTAVSIYYTKMDGIYPMASYPEGNTHYVDDGLSLTAVLRENIDNVFIPKVHDFTNSFNGFDGLNFDQQVESLMTSNPINDCYIYWGPAGPSALITAYVYDNKTGFVWIANGNYDWRGNFIFDW